jgi:protein ImuA
MSMPLHSQRITEAVAELAERVRQIERPRQPVREGLISSGDRRLDRLLPETGFRRGTLVEWLATGPGSGAGTLAMIAAREAARQGGAIVVIDRDALFYPPAAVRLGIDLEQLIVVRPSSDEDHAWAMNQVLRTRGVAAVWCEVDAQDDHTLRRWQLAAESSGALGLLVRPEAVRHDPSWAELRLLVESVARPRGTGRNRHVRVTLVRSRMGHAGRAVELELSTPDALPRAFQETFQETAQETLQETAQPRRGRRGTSDETRPVHLASPLAAAKTRRRARRA